MGYVSTLVFAILFQSVFVLPYSNQQAIQSVQFGHQNPILVAPTKANSGGIQPSPIVENPCDQHESADYESDYNIEPRARSIYDPISRKCYPLTRVTAQGPCKTNMKFYQRPDNPSYGFCDCDQDLPVVYHPDTDGCHQLFHREFCNAGQWLQLDANQNLKCRRNPCLLKDSETAEPEDIVLFEGKCVELGSRCGNDTSKFSTTRIRFADGGYEVTCDSRSFASVSFVGGGSLTSLECTKAGSRWSYATGTCKQIVSFTFS